jgi:hypothetical protein
MKNLLLSLLVSAFVADTGAAVFFIGFGPAEVGVRVGQPVGVSTVDVNVPVTNVGDSTPIVGVPPMFVGAYARQPFSIPLPVFTLTVDSSTPLNNGFETIPFTEISWVAATGDIPSGVFSGAPAQVILGPVIAAFVIIDTHTFSYANTALIASGTYTGTVTYTAAVP